MPIYEYACNRCGHQFETLVRSDDIPGCPTCRSTDLAKKLSVFAATGPKAEAAPCGSCGHPGGPGSCGVH